MQLWKGNELKPEEWGWKFVDGQLRPKLSDLPPAPDDLLKTIRCNCKKDCSSARCTYKRHKLECSVSCGECRGTSCLNPMKPSVDELATDSDIDDE